MTHWAYLDHDGPLAFAHRGGASERPENTMAAFEHAVSLGYRYLETDARTTSDGVLLAFHDEVLDRVTDRTGPLSDVPWSQVSRARIDGHPIPLLEDVLGTWPAIRVNVDIKTGAAVAALAEAIHRTGAHDRVCVAAFSDSRLRRFRRLARGQVCTALGPLGIARLRMSGPRWSAGGFSGACAQVPPRHRRVPIVDRRFVATAHANGIRVHVWTIDEAPEMERLLDLGVDGIMTDRPSVLRSVLERRGQWPTEP